MADTAVARETLFALRETIARMEGKAVTDLGAPSTVPSQAGMRSRETALQARRRAVLAFDVEAFDSRIGGGLPLNALTEIRGGELRDAGAVSGFALAVCALMAKAPVRPGRDLPRFLWIGEPVAVLEAGLPYARGWMEFGIAAQSLLYAAPRRIEEALWLAETALVSGAFAAVILEVRGNPARFGLTESRRLSLRARAVDRPLFVLRQAGEEEASNALLRLSVKPAPAAARPLPDGTMLGGSIGNPVFSLTLEKSRSPAFANLSLEWNVHDRLFRVPGPASSHNLRLQQPAHPGTGVSASADRPDRPQALGAVVAFSRAS